MYVCMYVCMYLTPEATKELLESRLRYLCDTVDGLPLRRQQKIKVYKLYVCPGMSWLLGLLDLPLSWIERKLDSVPTRFLKKWCGLAATTNPSILYLPEESFGLSLPKLSTTFQSITSCNLRYLLQSKDPMVQQLAEAEVHHQQQLCNRKFVPATLASFSLSCKDIRKVTEEHAELCHRKILEERVVQGALMRFGAQNHHHIWSSTLVHLPESIFKWCLNSVVDTLPHNSNLMRWNKSADDSCPLCSRKQTLSHVLNDCPVALYQHRYTWRHNKVLEVIRDYLSRYILDEYQFECDLPNSQYAFIRDTFCSVLRPDICVFRARRVYLIELINYCSL